MGNKATNAEAEQRVKIIAQLLLDGYPRPEILEYCSEKMGLRRAQTDNMISRATKRIKAINEIEVDQLIANVTSNYWGLFREARKKKNVAVAAQILGQISKLKGIEKTRIEHSGPDGGPIKYHMTREEMEAQIKADSMALGIAGDE
jgi:hypothetical protein